MQTKITRLMKEKGYPSSHPECVPDIANRKPYRTKELRRLARADAHIPKSGHWRGTYRSNVTRLYHTN